MLQYYTALSREERACYGSILAALIVGAIVCFGWKALAAIFVLAVALRIATRTPVRPQARRIHGLAFDPAPSDANEPDGPLPSWIGLDKHGKPCFVLVTAENDDASVDTVLDSPLPARPAGGDKAKDAVERECAERWEEKADSGAAYWKQRAEKTEAEYRKFAGRVSEQISERAAAEHAEAVKLIAGEHAKLTAEIVALKSRIDAELHKSDGARRDRRLLGLKKKLERAERRGSLAEAVRSRGGLNASLHAFQAASGFDGRADAIANGIPRKLLPKSGGMALDEIAQELVNNGRLIVPHDRHAPEVLLERIADGTADASYDNGERYAIAAEIEELERHADSFNVEEFA